MARSKAGFDSKKSGILGSGFEHRDRVMVDHCGDEETTGWVEGVHGDGKKVDVRVDKPGHKEHNRVVTFSTDDVELADKPAEEKEKTQSA